MSGRLVECDMADEVKRVEVLAYLIRQRLKGEPFVFELLDDGLFALGRFPAFEEIIQAGETLLQGLFGEVAQASR